MRAHVALQGCLAPPAMLRPAMSRRASRNGSGQVANKIGWSRPFEDPIPLSKGKPLVTLRAAAAYITKLPKAEQNLEPWQTAVGCLIGAAEGRDFLMHARVGMLRALNRHVERVFNPDRKDHHWGKRKLARDR